MGVVEVRRGNFGTDIYIYASPVFKNLKSEYVDKITVYYLH